MTFRFSSVCCHAGNLARFQLPAVYKHTVKLTPCRILAKPATANFHTSSTLKEEDEKKDFDYKAMGRNPHYGAFGRVTTRDKVTTKVEEWLSHNDIVYPPHKEGDLIRPAEIFHVSRDLKYSYKKMWYTACMVRGMSIDEALKQCDFIPRKGGKMIKDALLDAQAEAVKNHNVEFKSNLWIVDSFVDKSSSMRGLRKHAKGRFATIEFSFINYMLCLREGSPPPVYYAPTHLTGNEQMHNHLQDLRSRRIYASL